MGAYIIINSEEIENISIQDVEDCLKHLIKKFTITKQDTPFYMNNDFEDEDFENWYLAKEMKKQKNIDLISQEDGMKKMKKILENASKI